VIHARDNAQSIQQQLRSGKPLPLSLLLKVSLFGNSQESCFVVDAIDQISSVVWAGGNTRAGKLIAFIRARLIESR
jgi:hypothetical protein